MRKGLTAGLLVLTCLAASASVSAAQQVSRGSSDTYDWETPERGCVEIFRVFGTSTPATVLVHVEDQHRRGNNARNEHSGVWLENCNGRSSRVHVDRNETVQCKVWPGRPLIAESADNCDEEEGTVEVIKI